MLYPLSYRRVRSVYRSAPGIIEAWLTRTLYPPRLTTPAPRFAP